MSAPAAAPRLAAVLGWPIAHSLSPQIHRIWAAREGVNAHYVPIAVAPGYEAFARAADALAALGFSGCNVTLPHKENAFRYAARASADANAAGAANMLSFAEDGAYADNSDIAGFLAALDEAGGAGAGKAVLLGAGGAARAIALALSRLGCAPIVVLNRTRARADAVAALVGSGAAGAWEERAAALAGAGVLVNATSLGMAGAEPLELALEALPKDALVADIVANPAETALLARARARGHRTADGLSMLLHQAAPAYRAWFGREARVDADLRARVLAAMEGPA